VFRKKIHVKADDTIELKKDYDTESKVPEIVTASYSATGNRQYQQDAIYVTPGNKLAQNRKTRIMAIVCDGMGGMTDGGLASRIAVEKFAQAFEIIKNEDNISIPVFFTRGIKAIDKMISTIPKVNGKGSGTTMVAVIAEDNYLYWASVGDSRIYIIRGRNIIQVTRDHNYDLKLQELLRSGQITVEEYNSKKQKEALISFLGMGNVSLMDVNTKPFELNYGDMVVLCSDGVTKTLPDWQIRDIILNDAVDIKEKAAILVEAAIRGNTSTQDNTSVAILQYIESIINR